MAFGRAIQDAPSRHAAQARQHWVNRPNEFFKNMLNQEKKWLGLGEPEAEEVPHPEIKDNDDLLMALEGAVRPGEPVASPSKISPFRGFTRC